MSFRAKQKGQGKRKRAAPSPQQDRHHAGSLKDDIRSIREHRALNNYFGGVNDKTDIDLDRVTGFTLDRGMAYDDPHEVLERGERTEFEQQRPEDEEALERFGKDAMAAIRGSRPLGRMVWTVKAAAAAGDARMQAAAEQVTREAERQTFDPREPLPEALLQSHAYESIENSQAYAACEQLDFVPSGMLPEDELLAPDPLAEPERVYELATDVSGAVQRGANLDPLAVMSHPGLPATERVYTYRHNRGLSGPAFLLVLWLRQVPLPVGTCLVNSRCSATAPPEEVDQEQKQRALRRLVQQASGEQDAEEEDEYRVREEGLHGWYVARRHYVPLTWRPYVPLPEPAPSPSAPPPVASPPLSPQQ